MTKYLKNLFLNIKKDGGFPTIRLTASLTCRLAIMATMEGNTPLVSQVGMFSSLNTNMIIKQQPESIRKVLEDYKDQNFVENISDDELEELYLMEQELKVDKAKLL